MVYYSLNTWHLVNSIHIIYHHMSWCDDASRQNISIQPTNQTTQTIYGTQFSLKVLCVCYLNLLLLLLFLLLLPNKRKEGKKEKKIKSLNTLRTVNRANRANTDCEHKHNLGHLHITSKHLSFHRTSYTPLTSLVSRFSHSIQSQQHFYFRFMNTIRNNSTNAFGFSIIILDFLSVFFHLSISFNACNMNIALSYFIYRALISKPLMNHNVIDPFDYLFICFGWQHSAR